MIRYIKLLVLFFLCLVVLQREVNAQCTGAFGDIVAGTDFGSGTELYGEELNSLNTGNYGFLKGQPSDGHYTIAQSTAGMNHARPGGNWHLVNSRGGGDGYMMVINADYNPGIFYQEVKQDLCANTTYRLSAYVVNLLKDGTLNPKLTFIIEDAITNVELKSEDVPDIELTDNPIWVERVITFRTTANVTSVRIKIRNNAPGGNGNDLALDDITFRACGPQITANINTALSSTANMCIGESKNFTFKATPDNGVYQNPEFQWQENVNGIWQNLPGENTNQTIVKIEDARVGTHKYRMLVAENGSINSPTCRTNSPEFTIAVSPLPTPAINGSTFVCVGESINLTTNNANSYQWSGPDAITGNLQSLVIAHATLSMSGTYSVKVTNAAGCEETAEINISVIVPPIPEIAAIAPICKGSPVMLQASGGTTFRWLPAEGISDLNINNPTVTPLKTTKYTVFVGNGTCERSTEITVVVLLDPLADAGEDKKILKGKSTTLNGSRSGDEVTYFWTPATYLDDPLKLNPVASPPVSTTYTLNVVSRNGCTTSTAEVFVKVYDKLIVPNVFSPNGDGINDLWNITAIDTYVAPKVKIMDRNGHLVYQSANYTRAWDGRYQNHEVPVGVYYYIINLAPGLAPITGAITLLR